MFDWISAQLIVSAVVIVVVIHVILVGVMMCIYAERKISAYIQDRIGPNRTGFDFGLPALAPLKGALGLGQSLADGLKLLLKEDYTPERVDKVLFTLAPGLIVIPALIGFVVIPWGGTWVVPDFTIPLLNVAVEGGPVVVAGAHVNVGIVYLVATAALGVYGVTLGGWASNNKYSFLGGLRATAQMLAYEIPLGLSLLAVLLVIGSVMPEEIVRQQVSDGWTIVAQPIAAAIFFIAALAEANRAPFDNAEAEAELVGGYHTEYSSMRFALFLLAEYSHVITSSAFFVLLFLGGYHLPLIPWLNPEETSLAAALLKVLVYATKVVLMIAFVMLVRWSLPRMRYDQVMMMAWQAVIPLSLVVVVVTSVVVYLDPGRTLGLPWGLTLPLLAANVLIAGALLGLYPLLPRYSPNRKIALYGSRFNPVQGEVVSTRPTDPMALEDRPVEGTVATKT